MLFFKKAIHRFCLFLFLTFFFLIQTTSSGFISVTNAISPTPNNSAESQACSGLEQFNGFRANCTNGSKTYITSIVKKIIDILSYIIGIAAIIMIIFAGFRYVTSGGDSGSVKNAKNTLIYAIVGLAIAALVQVIVIFGFPKK